MKSPTAAALAGLLLSIVVASRAALADGEQQLLPRDAMLDDSPPQISAPEPGRANQDSAASQPSSTTLNGSVSHTDKIRRPASITGFPGRPGGFGVSSGDSLVNIGPGALFSGTAGGRAIDPEQLKALVSALRDARNSASGNLNGSLNGLGAGPGVIVLGGRRAQMSADDYRKMEYGIIGLTSTLPFDTDCPVVTRCYPTCPAAEAGIKPGDELISAGDHVFRRGDGQAIAWQSIAGKAGTPVEIKVRRQGQELTFHLTRMNIEDIKDDMMRKIYEMYLSNYGAPGQH